VELQACRFDPELAAKVTGEWVGKTGVDMYFGIIETKGMFMDLPGVKVSLPPNDQGHFTDTFFKTIEDVETKEFPDALSRKECPNLHRYVVDQMVKTRAAVKTGALGACWGEGVLTTTALLRGTEELLMDMLMEPEIAKKAIKRGKEWSDQVVRATYADTADYIIDTDPVASASLIDESMFREFVFEPTRQNIAGWKKDLGLPVMVHICGDTTPMLDQFAKLGNEIQSIDHLVDMSNARKIVGNKLTIMGNVNPVDVIWQGSAKDVKAASKKCFDDAGRNGRFIIGPGCAIPRDAPIANVKAMVEASKECRY
jgi:MtaA/CmuA family methyltransferase